MLKNKRLFTFSPPVPSSPGNCESVRSNNIHSYKKHLLGMAAPMPKSIYFIESQLEINLMKEL